MTYRSSRSNYNQTRTICTKFAGKCACCGGGIAAGEMVDYYPARRQIAHIGGLDGNSGRCTAEIRKQRDPGFVDLDRMVEDQCADICGR